MRFLLARVFDDRADRSEDQTCDNDAVTEDAFEGMGNFSREKSRELSYPILSLGEIFLRERKINWL